MARDVVCESCVYLHDRLDAERARAEAAERERDEIRRNYHTDVTRCQEERDAACAERDALWAAALEASDYMRHSRSCAAYHVTVQMQVEAARGDRPPLPQCDCGFVEVLAALTPPSPVAFSKPSERVCTCPHQPVPFANGETRTAQNLGCPIHGWPGEPEGGER